MIEIFKLAYEHPVATCFFLLFISLCIPNIRVYPKSDKAISNNIAELRDMIRRDLKQEKKYGSLS